MQGRSEGWGRRVGSEVVRRAKRLRTMGGVQEGKGRTGVDGEDD